MKRIYAKYRMDQLLYKLAISWFSKIQFVKASCDDRPFWQLVYA
jgi:hypothetical protein